MINESKLSEEKLLAVIQETPPLCFPKMGFKKSIFAPYEIRKVRDTDSISFLPETGVEVADIDIRTRLGLAEGESISRWCCAQARAKDVLHGQRSKPFDAAPEQLSIGTWNSGPPRSDVGSIEFYRSMCNHIIFAQEFDHGDSPLPRHFWKWPSKTLQECSFDNCGMKVAGACGGCLVGIRKSVFLEAETLWEYGRDGFMYGVIVQVKFSTKIAGHESLVVGSVHFHNDRIKKPVAGMDLVTN